MTKALCVLPAVALLLTVAHATPSETVGRASVIDGDTIEISGTRFRLNGVDAPESSQLCHDAEGTAYRCGQVAALALADWLDQAQPVSCKHTGRNWTRVVAVCHRAGTDLGAWLVQAGHALDWPRYSKGKYAGAEAEARGNARGVWQGRFDLPWEWRKKKREGHALPTPA